MDISIGGRGAGKIVIEVCMRFMLLLPWRC
jgi:hypothetical protein